MKGPEAIPLSFALLPELLKTKGYRTAALGKWNLGDSFGCLLFFYFS